MAVRERDVAAREKKDNLREAKEDFDMEEIESIKDKMKRIKRRRIDLSND